MAITPRGMSVTEAYRAFRDGLFIVNRTYQRKLVWTLEEKVRFIDSILRHYPVPLILLAQMNDGRRYEIIDGMQRLNALFSFIETAFPLADGKYFNVDEFPRAKEAADSGLFESVSSTNRLSRTECADILDYQLAVTIFSVSDESNVTDIFGRINSGGKQLSPQEQRQAGIVTQFASFVRKLSSELRGDASQEIINLADMPLVSVDAPSFRLGYGVHAEDTFWCKQGILRTKELRDSLDEEVLADICASILMVLPFAVSRERLDEVYDSSTDLYNDINNRLAAYSETRLATEIKATFSCLSETIESVDSSPNAFRRRIDPGARGNPVRTPFYAVFMAFHKLIVRQQKKPVDPPAILQSLDGLGNRLKTGSHHVRTSDREKNIAIVFGLIQDSFAYAEPPILLHGPGLALDFENSLRRSRIETPRYEFKQGLLRLSVDRSPDSGLVPRLAEIACSIANIGPESIGYIFLGVADKESDALRINTLDHITALSVGNLYVVGIEREAVAQGKSVDQYTRDVISGLRSTNLSDPLKSDMLSKVDTINYRGLSIIRLTIPSQRQISWVADKSYIREGSETREATARQIAAITQRFQ